MRHLPSDKYNIAWFKLAECVSRGEKERALGVYRLLSHSIEDHAFVQQLEGDLLLAFGDTTTAVQKYQAAMEHYKHDGRLLEAVSVGEHVFLLTTDKRSCAVQLSKLYKDLGTLSKTQDYAGRAVDMHLDAGLLEAAMEVLEEIELNTEVEFRYMQRKKILRAHVFQGTTPHNLLVMQAQKIIDLLLQSALRNEVQTFFVELELLDAQLHKILCEYGDTDKPLK